MKKKLLGILICTLMIINAYPILGLKNINNNSIDYESSDYIPGTYLIDTEWGQHGYYKSKCPWECPLHLARCRLGCWSVAIGQIINYHSIQHPELLQSTGFVHYVGTNESVDSHIINNDLDEYDYDWSKMANKLNFGSSIAEKDNVSLLLYDTATVIQKDFGTGGYCTIDNTNAVPDLIDELLEHFPAINSFTVWDNDLTEEEIKNEIDHGRPIMFYTLGHNYADNGSSFGHAMVIDGYDYVIYNDYPAFYIHLNFGWDGSPDPLANTWYYYYGNFPCYSDDLIMDRRDHRKGLLIRPSPWINVFEGPLCEWVGNDCPFTVASFYDTDPPVYYMFDWDDETPYEWLGPYQEGQICTTYHSWNSPGIYNIKVKAKNSMGSQSDWSEPLTIHITRYNTLIPILELLLVLIDLIPPLEPYLTIIIWFICS
jgi:hypothetical protein